MAILYFMENSAVEFIFILLRPGHFLLHGHFSHKVDPYPILDMAILYFIENSAVEFIFILMQPGHFSLHVHFSHEVYPYSI